MKGVILCGGSSTRMGADKGLLKEGETTWAELAAGKLAALNLPVFISINNQQLSSYQQIFPQDRLLVDQENFHTKAPLFGLLSVHLALPDDDLLVLACDIKHMTEALLNNLLYDYNLGPHEAIAYQTGDLPQPLCAVYTSAGLKKIYSLYKSGDLGRYSMMHALEVIDTKYLPVAKEDVPAFENYNYPVRG